MESAVMAPGNARLKGRGKSTPGRSARIVARNHSFNNNNKNNRSGVVRSNHSRNNSNQRHLNILSRGPRCSHQIVHNAAFVNNINANNGNDTNDIKFIFGGDFTREVYNAICPRLGHTLRIPEDSVQALFNDMKLYPSKDQVSEMLKCARQCGRRNGSSKYITFGEFCVFVKEMKNQTSKQHRKIQPCKPNSKCVNNCEVFLGGSCNPTTWRADTAIPELQKHGITFYNPVGDPTRFDFLMHLARFQQVSMWVPELVAQEHDAKQAASVLLYVVDSQTRSTVGMIEVAYLVASGRCVVVVAHSYRPGQSIMGETITQREYKDLVEGQTTLLTLVRSKGVEVHKTLPSALQCTARILRNASGDVTPEEHLTNKLRTLREVFDSYGGQSGEMDKLDFLKAFEQLTHHELTTAKFYKYLSSSTNQSINFERFCLMMAEFTGDSCDTSATNGWISQPLQRQCSTNNNNNNNNNNTCNSDTSLTNGTVEESANITKPRQYSYDVFLGGTQNSRLRWRQEMAIPILERHDITYNPSAKAGHEVLDNHCATDRDILEWKSAIDGARIVLFVVTDDTRSLTTMILAAHYIALGQNVVLCVQQLPEENCVVGNESLSEQAVKDYNRARVYVRDMAKRRQIPVFEDIADAVQCVVSKVQGR